ncbi:MAG: alpha/beta hydrolase [Alphaproteobacteria bacterium]|nr:alpha/beta hydrolase [Alphaproteobacteria bacterium]
MMTPHRYLGLGPGGFHRIAYVEWGLPGNPRVCVCVHGLTRNGRDFDELAQALQQHWRVLCPDVVGRGDSDRLADPAQYGYPQYLNDMTALVARAGAARVDWVGTSMGGLIGMMMAAQANSPVRRLVVNDIGPFIPKAGLERIASYVGKDPRFATLADAEAALRKSAGTFGLRSDDEWRRFTERSVRAVGGGQYGMAYDPAIAKVFGAALHDIDLWSVWDKVRCPVLVLRGAESDVLPQATAEEMKHRGPGATVVEFAGCGHAPALMDAAQIAVVRDWLLGEAR